jgi:hypothetical protein
MLIPFFSLRYDMALAAAAVIRAWQTAVFVVGAQRPEFQQQLFRLGCC